MPHLNSCAATLFAVPLIPIPASASTSASTPLAAALVLAAAQVPAAAASPLLWLLITLMGLVLFGLSPPAAVPIAPASASAAAAAPASAATPAVATPVIVYSLALHVQLRRRAQLQLQASASSSSSNLLCSSGNCYNRAISSNTRHLKGCPKRLLLQWHSSRRCCWYAAVSPACKASVALAVAIVDCVMASYASLREA
jgi:hypothetical protein